MLKNPIVPTQRTLSHHKGRVNALALSADGQYLLSGGAIIVWPSFCGIAHDLSQAMTQT